MAYEPSFDAVKVEQLAQTAWTLLDRQIVLPKLIQTVNGFQGALDDKITIKVPGRANARRRDLRPATEVDRKIELDTITEQKFHVELTENIYSAVPIEDEVATLDLESFARQILAPQVRAVAVAYEDLVADEISSATYVHEVDLDEAKPFHTVVDASRLLDVCFVPRDGRILLVGSGVKTALLKSDQFITAISAGDAIAGQQLRTGQLGQIAGYSVYESMALPENEAYLFHKSAFAASTVTPVVPRGASYGKQLSGTDAPSLTWIMDYDAIYSRDRSILHFYAGANTFADKADARADNALVQAGGLLRAVKIVGDFSN